VGVPAVGEHTGAVLTELLGLSPAQIADLAEAGVVSRP
jgi:crotonobetainyl-CoA:carnitine CoA-transferase CaiB-like acyl-CoA transferase